MRSDRLRIAAGLAALAFLVAVSIRSLGHPPGGRLPGSTSSPGHTVIPPPGSENLPSIVLIVTDDQRADSLDGMPIVRERLGEPGVTFEEAFVVNSLCCPSRASILTGQYSHSTGVWRNRPPYGGWASFDDRSTIATWLQAAGYTTAHVGKYLNGYYGTSVPPGWDRWVAFSGARPYRQPNLYENYQLNEDGLMVGYGSDPDAYSTDVLAERAVEFIQGTGGPLFLQFAPYAPHTPATPAARHAGVAMETTAPASPAYDEADVSDKPEWVRQLPRLDAAEHAHLRSLEERQRQTLLAVDEAVGEILDALEETGRLSNTMVVFTSDNGYSLGEHRWSNKQTAYEPDLRVPFVVRYDPLPRPGGVEDSLTLNIDLAPTFAALAGVSAPGAEGRSLLPLLEGSAQAWRDDFLFEHLMDEQPLVPTYCGVRTETMKYVRYREGEEELYDLVRDPFELENVATAPGYSDDLGELRARLDELCVPPPPPDPPPQSPPG